MDQDVTVGRFKVRRLMRQRDLKALQPQRFRPRTTHSINRLASPNLLKEAAVNSPKSVLVEDITYLSLKNGGWCYLASWQDKFTRRIVGWKVVCGMEKRP